MKRTIVAALCAVFAVACGQDCFTWKDITGKNRMDQAMMVDVRLCNERSGLNEQLAIQAVWTRRFSECMSRREPYQPNHPGERLTIMADMQVCSDPREGAVSLAVQEALLRRDECMSGLGWKIADTTDCPQ